jgi:hypothetical protein
VNHLENLTKLLTLDLESAKVTNGGLTNIGNLNSLISLNIPDGANIDDAGLAHLAGLTKLKKLFAQRNPDITDEGMKHLQGMQAFDLRKMKATPTGSDRNSRSVPPFCAGYKSFDS